MLWSIITQKAQQLFLNFTQLYSTYEFMLKSTKGFLSLPPCGQDGSGTRSYLNTSILFKTFQVIN